MHYINSRLTYLLTGDGNGVRAAVDWSGDSGAECRCSLRDDVLCTSSHNEATSLGILHRQ